MHPKHRVQSTKGGELGYSLAHAFGSVFDNPDLITACVVGDGEAETGPLATAWQSNKFLNPINDGAVLPILHLNGYKIFKPNKFSHVYRTKKSNHSSRDVVGNRTLLRATTL